MCYVILQQCNTVGYIVYAGNIIIFIGIKQTQCCSVALLQLPGSACTSIQLWPDWHDACMRYDVDDIRYMIYDAKDYDKWMIDNVPLGPS
jgi:hypothetical protein